MGVTISTIDKNGGNDENIGRLKLATVKETTFFLAEAEKFDNYLNKINENIHNTTSRIGMYYESVYPDINETKREQITEWLVDFQEKNEKWQILLELLKKLKEIWILPLSYSADGGMPHTRGTKYICVPGGFFDVDRDNGMTLKHELIHLHQKMDRQKWDKLYSDSWDWKPWRGKLPEKYEAIRRINPDTEWCGALYVIKNTWVPFCVYREIDRPNVRHTIVWYYNIYTGMVWKSTGIFDLPPEIADDSAWTDTRINMAMREHPNEMSAWFLASPEKYENCILSRLFSRNWPKLN